ncbi:MAG: cystathionine gamma-synthase [Candidatus Dadabacteria bacterium]|nr:MAG: cystathionine gamma-synthase [Candidatus Dadabacteria bacterium]
MKEGEYRFSTKAIHAGQEPDPLARAVMVPVYQTSTYSQEEPGKPKNGYEYARTANPTRTALENNLAALEGGKYGLCFASGLAAIDAVLHLFESGAHIVLCDDVYGGTFRLFNSVFKKHGIDFSIVDMSNADNIREAIRPDTRMVWFETPTNPMLKIVDIEEVVSICREKGVLSAVDNTFASPYLQQPLKYGVDIVCHSSTKYIGGHSDVVGGALITNSDEYYEKLKFIQNAVGAVPGPWDVFLLLRSTKTLSIRMEKHCDNAEKVAEFLLSHSKVEKVYYPGLEEHNGHNVAKKQMRRFGGMISCVLKSDLDGTLRFLRSVRLFTLAESLGGVESLIEHPAIMTHASVPKEQREALGIVDSLVRLSVGIEDAEDLIEDLEGALSKI